VITHQREIVALFYIICINIGRRSYFSHFFRSLSMSSRRTVVASRVLTGTMLAALSFAIPALAKDLPVKSAKTMPELIKASSAADWRALNPENTLYLELEKGRVVIELAPDFARNMRQISRR
jgi:hypothetical protein